MTTLRAPAPKRCLLATLAILAALAASACTAHLFSGVPLPDRSRPVVRIETRGGVEYGAATEFGVLFLGRTAQRGPCRVHYYLGPDHNVDDATIERAGGVFLRADVDLAQQSVPILTRPVQPGDELIALIYAGDGDDVAEVELRLADGDTGVGGSVLHPPSRELPAGTGIFVRPPDDAIDQRLRCAGLVAGLATLEQPDGGSRRYLVYAGVERLREMLARPEREPAPTRVRFRPDGIWVREPVPEGEMVDR